MNFHQLSVIFSYSNYQEHVPRSIKELITNSIVNFIKVTPILQFLLTLPTSINYYLLLPTQNSIIISYHFNHFNHLHHLLLNLPSIIQPLQFPMKQFTTQPQRIGNVTYNCYSSKTRLKFYPFFKYPTILVSNLRNLSPHSILFEVIQFTI